MQSKGNKSTKPAKKTIELSSVDDDLSPYYGDIENQFNPPSPTARRSSRRCQKGENTTADSEDAGWNNNVTAKMNTALLAAYTAIHRLLVEAERQDVQSRYEIALHCQQVRDGDGVGGTYGRRAVVTLAKALGWHRSTVYEYANVAKTWPDRGSFDEIAARTDAFGKPLTWSNIVLLAAQADPERRTKLIDQCLENGWTNRQLSTERRRLVQPENADTDHEAGIPNVTVAACETGDSDEASTYLPPKPPRVLEIAVGNFLTQITALGRNVNAFNEQCMAEINNADASDLPWALAELERARTPLKTATDRLEERIRHVKQRLEEEACRKGRTSRSAACTSTKQAN